MKRTILLLTGLFSLSILLASPRVETEKSASHTVKVSAMDVINIQGKNTYVEIESRESSEVQVDAKITFNGKMTDKMQRFIDEFEANVKSNIKLSGGELLINAQLDLPNRVQVGTKNLGINIGYGDKELRLEYSIKVPSSNKLLVKSAYEDLVMDGSYDFADITQYSADLSVESIKNGKLNLKYGDAQIGYLGDVELELYENDTEIREIEKSNLNIKYSDLDVDEVGLMNVIAYEADIQVGTAEKMTGNLKYGSLNIRDKVSFGILTLYEFKIEGEAMGNLVLENSKYSKVELDRANEIKFMMSYEDKLSIRYLNTLTAKSKYGHFEIMQLGNRIDLDGYEDDVEVSGFTQKAKSIDIRGKYIKLEVIPDGRSYSLLADLKYGKVEYEESSLNIKKYIKENDKIFIEAESKSGNEDSMRIQLNGYELKAKIQ